MYLDVHGLAFETSICYWQDQPGIILVRRDTIGGEYGKTAPHTFA